MSYKPCLFLGCPRLVGRGGSYCSDHDPGPFAHKETFRERFGMSNAQWTKLARKVKRRDGRQCCCNVAGCHSDDNRRCPATERLEVDHILPRAAGGDNSMSNLQTLCHACHTAKTGRDRRSEHGGR